MQKIIVKVQVLRSKEGKAQNFKDEFVEVPKEMYEDALQEKKSTYSLASYVRMFTGGYLKNHYKLIDYIQERVGRIDTASIQRINVIK